MPAEVSLEEASVPGLPPPKPRGDAVEELRALLGPRTEPERPEESFDSLSLDSASLSLEALADSIEVVPLDDVPFAPPISIADIPVRVEDTGSGTWDEDIEISDPEADDGEFLDWLATGVQPPVAEDSGELSVVGESSPDPEPGPADAPPEEDQDVLDTAEAVAETEEVVAETMEALAETMEALAETMEDTSDVGLAVTEEALPLDEVLAGVSGRWADAGSLTDEGPAETEELAPLTDEGPAETEELAPLTDEGPAETEELAPLTDEAPVVTEELALAVEQPIGSSGDLVPDLSDHYEIQPTGKEPPVADTSFDIPVETAEQTHAETEPSLEPPPITIDEPTLRDELADLEEPTEPASLRDLLQAAASVSLELAPEDEANLARDPDDVEEDTEYVTSRFDREGPWVAPLEDEVLPWPVAVVGLTEVLPGEWSPPAGHSLSSPMPAGTGTHEEELELDLASELELDAESVADVEIPELVAPEPSEPVAALTRPPDRDEPPSGPLDTPVSADVAADSIDSSEAKEDWLRGLDSQPEVSVGYDVEVIPSVTMEDLVPRDAEAEADLPTQLTSKVELERALAQLESAAPEELESGGGAPTRPLPASGGDAPTRRLDEQAEAAQTRRVEAPDDPPTLVERRSPASEPSLAIDEDEGENLVTEIRAPDELESALAAASLDDVLPQGPDDDAAAVELIPQEDAGPAAEVLPALEEPAVEPELAPDPAPAALDPGPEAPSEVAAAAVVTLEPAREDDDPADLSLDDLELDELSLDELDLYPSEADAVVPRVATSEAEPSPVEARHLAPPAKAPAGAPSSLTVAAVVSTLRAVRQEQRSGGGAGPVWLELGDPVGTPAGAGGLRPLWLELADPGPAEQAAAEPREPRIELDDSTPGLTSLTLEGTEDEPGTAEVVAEDGAVRVELGLGSAPPDRQAATHGVAVAPAEPIRSWQGKPVPDSEPTTDLVALARLGQGTAEPPEASPDSEPSTPDRGDDWLDEVARGGDPDEEAPMSPYYVDTQPVHVPQEVRQAARTSIGKDGEEKPRRRRRRRKKK